MTITKPILPFCRHTNRDRAWHNLLLPDGADVDDMRQLIPEIAPAPLPPIIISPTAFTLKNFEYSSGLSQETNAFAADVWFRQEKIAHARNSGNGGETHVQAYEGMRAKMVEAEAWARTYPPQSSYQTLYQAMLALDNTYTDLGSKDLLHWWNSTSQVDLLGLIDDWVAKKAHRKSTAKISSKVVFSPCRGREDYPVVMQYKKPATPEMIAAARVKDGCEWGIPYARFLDLPYHYYPSPHPFASDFTHTAPNVQHIMSGKIGKVSFDTNDEVVIMQVEDPKDKIYGIPSEFKFVTEG